MRKSLLLIIVAGLSVALAGEFLGVVPNATPEDLAARYAVVGLTGHGVLVVADDSRLTDFAALGGTYLAENPKAHLYYTVRLFADATRAALAATSRIIDFDGEEYVVEVEPNAVEQFIAVPAMRGRISLNGWVMDKTAPELPRVLSNPTIEQLVALVSPDSVLAAVRRLQNYRNRYSTGDSCKAAAQWIAAKFRAYGCDTVILENHTSNHAPNVVGIRYGLSGRRNPYAIIDGHFDSYAASNAPGADDNASGTVSAIEACRVMQGFQFQHDLRFIAFSGEEFGLFGSDYYAGQAHSRGDTIIGVLNFDMIAYEDVAPEDLEVIGKIASPPCEPFCDWFIAVADTYTTLPCNKVMLNDMQSSDQGPFWNNGYLAFCGIEDYWPGNPHYHTPHDTIGAGYNSNAFCTNVIRAGVAALATMGEPVRHDVGATRILVPTGTLDSGAVVTPACSVYNYGSVAETYYVRLRIGGLYDQTALVSSHAPESAACVTFPNWTALPRGTMAVTCSTELGGDSTPDNDKQTGTVSVRVIDAEASTIVAPVGSADSGRTVVPQARVTNNGTENATFDVTFGIAGTYSNTQPVTDLAPGASMVVEFADWTASPRGTFPTTCTTRLAGDQVPANNTVSGTVTVAVHDIAALAVSAPAGFVLPGGVVTPAARIRNYGSQREACNVFFRIDCVPVYRDSLALPGGLPFTDTVATFANWTAIAGRHTATCSTWMAGDQQPANNTVSQGFVVGNPGWAQKSSMPAGSKAIKDGGWLAYDAGSDAGTGLIYASRGNKTPDFFSYNPLEDSWKVLAPWLPGTEGKLPGKGSVGCADGNGIIYATKGNNKQGFWKYDAAANAWTQMKDVPLGLSNKKVKGGTDIVWAHKGGTGCAYLLKGHKNEFYRYDTGADSWQTLSPAPIGSNAKWDKGSWLASDGAHAIYAHKAKYMEFHSYNTEADSWSGPLTPMPIPGSAGSKKAKDGCVAAVPIEFEDGRVYALKGGNTQEFWQYTIASNSWAEKETMPKGVFKKKVKSGADIVAVGGVMYATKGNKSNEFWMYVPSGSVYAAPRRDGVLAERLTIGDWRLAISPNPLASGLAHLAVGGTSLSRLALVRLYDASGRCVGVWKPLLRYGAADLDLRHLAAGVYLVRVETAGFSATQKLVVQK